ncbi:MAG: LacI family DNA-binding transcriptional regulator [Opitutaceae bacterium]|nr:LacI family DNA-binding transcriptional regulator [Opitutaceae bacterium]
MPSVSLRQIAEQAGCTRATVCYALQNASNVSVETKRRVHAIAERMGWRPNAELSRQMALTRSTLKDSLRCNIALVIQKPAKELESDPIPRRQFRGAIERAGQLGFNGNVFNLAEEALSPRRLRAIFHSRNVQGVVFVATVGSSFSRDYLNVGKDFATSVAAVRYPEVGYHVAITDFLANGLIACQAMREAGFKRIGAMMPKAVEEPLDYNFSAGLVGGYLKHYGKADLPIIYGASEKIRLVPEDRPAIFRWINTHKFDAVLTSDHYHFAEYIQDYPGRKPRIFSLNYHTGALGAEGGVDQLYELAGAAAVDLVVAQLHRGERGEPGSQKSIQIAGKWIWPRKR